MTNYPRKQRKLHPSKICTYTVCVHTCVQHTHTLRLDDSEIQRLSRLYGTFHDSDSITIVLNIIRSSVGRFYIRQCTINALCYVKELLKSKVGVISPIYKYIFHFHYE